MTKMRDLSEEQRNLNLTNMFRTLDEKVRAANDAFERNSKLLTASNAGGIISVVGYLGTVKPVLNYFIILTLSAFFIGLISNGTAMFKAVKRHAENRHHYWQWSYKAIGNAIEVEDFNKEINERQTLSDTGKAREHELENLSRDAFIIGVLLTIVGMIIKVASS